MAKLKRILILPSNTGGTINYICEALNKLNFEANILTFDEHKFRYFSNKVLFDKKDNFIMKEIKKILALRNYYNYDCIIFNYGRSLFSIEIIDKNERFYFLKKLRNLYYKLMRTFEFFFLKILQKYIVVIFCGDDARQFFFCLENFFISPAKYFKKNVHIYKKIDRIKVNNIKFINNYANDIFALNPDIMHVLPKRTKFLPYPYKKVFPKRNIAHPSSKLSILHAPSNRDNKGTDLIIDVVNRMNNSDLEFKINLVILENKTNKYILDNIEKFDLIIDQLLIGWYGSISVESMALGIPVICYIREEDLGFIPQQMRKEIPIINADQFNLEKKIIEFMRLTKKQVNDLSQKSIRYIHKWHSIESTSIIFKDLLTKNKPNL